MKIVFYSSSSNSYQKENFEITSLVGCISCNNRIHLHISISDNKGNCLTCEAKCTLEDNECICQSFTTTILIILFVVIIIILIIFLP